MAYSVLGRLCANRTLKHHLINKIIGFLSTNEISTGIQPLLQSENLVKHYQTNLKPVEDGYKNAQRIFSPYDADVFSLVESDIKDIYGDIRKELSQHTNNSELLSVATYYFNGRGKAGVPITMILMARAINYHMKKTVFQTSQRQLALIVEMIYAMACAQDDVSDIAVTRRGQPSINVLWNYKQVLMARWYVVAVAFIMTSRLEKNDVFVLVSKLVTEINHGELMHAGLSKECLNVAENNHTRITQCLNILNLRAGCFMGYSVKAASVLAGADEELSEIAFQYGRNIGLLFQIMDDYEDLESDIEVGLANAPVLFACEEFPELNEMIKRKFEDEGDVEKALEMVHKSKALEQTQLLAKKYCLEAVRFVNSLQDSPYKQGLTIIPRILFNQK